MGSSRNNQTTYVYAAGLNGICLALLAVPLLWLFTGRERLNQTNTNPLSQLSHNATSGWCSGKTNIDRFCRFKNLCFSGTYDTFVFLHGQETIMEGIPNQRFMPALVDLSSVMDHNTQYFHYVDAGIEMLDALPHMNHVHKMGKYLLFNRFNPSNLMHVFHDDLLPIFYTLHHHGEIDDSSNLILLLFEGWTRGEFYDLYRPFSKGEPVLKQDLGEDTLTCFDEIYVGLSKLSTWYQYGFNRPQGPIPDSNITSFHIKHFREFFARTLNVHRECTTDGAQGLLLSRELNRLIINEGELALTISHIFKVKMLILSLESHSLHDIIQEISCSKILIGVHGSLLILSMFLPSSSILLEIFPFAINPDHYTPYKTLVSLPGMDLHYAVWRNVREDNTVTYPDAPPEYGGISHLDPEMQQRILRSSEVRPHLCCKDPEWLFRIYQDTVVDIPEIIKLLAEYLAVSSQDAHEVKQSWMNEMTKHHLAPGHIIDFTCNEIDHQGHRRMNVSWLPPWNIDLINLPEVTFEVWIQVDDTYTVWPGLTHENFLLFPIADHEQVYSIWVRALSMGVHGPQSYFQCVLN